MIAFVCPHCQQQNTVGDEWAGRQGECPACRQGVEIPAAATPSAAPVVFPCVYCGHKLSVAGAYAGRTGQCPACRRDLQIPLASVPVSAAGPTRPRPTPEPEPDVPEPAGDVVFSCGHCGNKLSVPRQWAGKQGTCPACNRAVRIPAHPAPASPPPRAPAGGKIVFHCVQCGRKASVGAEWAGKPGRCPWCNAALQVPLASTVPGDEPPRETYALADEPDDGRAARPRPPDFGPADYRPPRTRPPYDPADDPVLPRDTGGGDYSAIGWVALIVIFVIGNIILYKATGWILIPRR